MANLTTLQLKALNSSDADKRLSDGHSMFGLVRTKKVTNEVSVDFEWRYRFNGKTRHARIGSWPKISLQQLRNIRAQFQAQVTQGFDPLEEKQIERLRKQADLIEAQHLEENRLHELAKRDARLTFKSLYELWHAQELVKRQDKGKETRRAFTKDVFPLIENLALEDITKNHIQSIIDQMMARGIVRMTKRVLSDLRQLFGYAVDRDYLSTDPTARIKKAKLGKDTERDRYLSESELIELFRLLPDSGLKTKSILALQLQMATLARIGEVLAAEWAHIDTAQRQWTLPVTKNGKKHTIWLSDFALEKLHLLKEISGDERFLFPSSRKTNHHLNEKTITKQVADRQRGEQPPLAGRTSQKNTLTLIGGQWRPHDLRRTSSTLMAELQIQPHIIELCLNHTEPSKLKRIYVRAQYESQLRQAWSLLGDRLTLLQTKPANVALLHAA